MVIKSGFAVGAPSALIDRVRTEGSTLLEFYPTTAPSARAGLVVCRFLWGEAAVVYKRWGEQMRVIIPEQKALAPGAAQAGASKRKSRKGDQPAAPLTRRR
jgi:hypothetical protein